MKHIILHHPLPINPEGTSGSSVRPYKMLTAFERVGYTVELVAGYASDRLKAIRRIERDIQRGRQFLFCYAESATTPSILTEKHHIPLHPTLDFRFFAKIREKGIPLGLYYRDVYWRFPYTQQNLARWKSLILNIAYRYEWKKYEQLADHLFVQSHPMIAMLPSPWPSNRISILPPGCVIQPWEESLSERNSDCLNLFYVGGVLPPLYDMRPIVNICRNVKDIHLTLCCRPEEWKIVRSLYEPFGKNVSVVHAYGSDLLPHYQRADAFIMYRPPDPYLDFVAPVKLFEAIGHGLPIITNANTETARIIEQEDIGWSASNIEELNTLLRHLMQNRDAINRKRAHLRQVREHHTWEARTRQVASILSGS